MRLSAALILGISTMVFCGISVAQVPSARNTLRSNTRLITVDVVVTDSHGKAVRGLTEKDFNVFEDHGVQQHIARFEFVDAHAKQKLARGSVASLPAGMFSNRSVARTQVAPTVLLMDGLNTTTIHQMQIRRDMVLFLKKLPPDTPVAVFLLEHELHVVQNFTTDPAVLRAAVKKAGSPTTKEKYPQYDANSPSNVTKDLNPETPAWVVQNLEDFEKGDYEAMIEERVEETADAMRAIANYLRGYPGRKNVIWFSEVFPIWVEPNSDFGTDPFYGSGSYHSKVEAAAASLMDAGVAVYPVDARGLEPNLTYSVANNVEIDRRNPGASFAGAITQDDQLRLNSQATMEQMATETGGHTCKNTNDLVGCVFRALNQDSSYYELSYYPTNVKWDNQLHKISIKTSVHGVRLAYRRGYFATNSAVLMKHEKPNEILKDACRDPLPSTAIGLAVAAFPLKSGPGRTGDVRYLLTISPKGWTAEPDGKSLHVDVQMAICEFDPQGDKFAFYPRDLSRTVTNAVYQSWKENGIRDIFDYRAKPENRRLRFVVLDLPTGDTGSVDVPAHPREFAVSSGKTAAGSRPVAPRPVAPAKAAPPTHVNFRLPSGQTGSLDWGGDKLTYHGDLGLNLAVPAFFNSLYSSKFACVAGKLKSKNPSGGSPNFLFNFRNPAGLIALVDVGGREPIYSGNLPVDATAKAFFGRLWKLCHCQAP